VKILSLNQVSLRQTDAVFGASALRAALWAVVAFAVLALACYALVVGHVGYVSIPRWWVVGVGLFCLFIAGLTTHTWRAARRPSNWVLRIQGNDVLIKFRSFEHWRMSDDDPQVIVLHSDEIKSVRKSVRRQIATSMDNKGVQAIKFVELEIALVNRDLSEVEKALAAEAAHKTGLIDDPVSVADGGAIRISWRNGSSSVRPGIGTAIAALGRIATVAEAQKTTQDVTASALKNLPDDEQTRNLRELARHNPFEAAATARRLYGYSRSQAMEFVEKLAATADTEMKP
jgi:hypothetical protein